MNATVKINKSKIALDAIIATAKGWGLKDKDIMVQLGESPFGKGHPKAIYIDGDVYDMYNSYAGIFAAEVAKRIGNDFYLEHYTYSILTVSEI